MATYKTFIRTCKDWRSFAKAKKRTDRTGLTYEEASTRAKNWNAERSQREINAGTKMEFVIE